MFLVRLILALAGVRRSLSRLLSASPSGSPLLPFGLASPSLRLALPFALAVLVALRSSFRFASWVAVASLGLFARPCWCGFAFFFVWGFSHGCFSFWCFFFLSCCGGCFFRPLVSFVLVCVRCVCLWCFLRVSCPWCFSPCWSCLVACVGCGSCFWFACGPWLLWLLVCCHCLVFVWVWCVLV